MAEVDLLFFLYDPTKTVQTTLQIYNISKLQHNKITTLRYYNNITTLQHYDIITLQITTLQYYNITT